MGYEWTELTYQDRLTRDFTVPGTKIKVPVLAAVMLIVGAARRPGAGGAVRELDACRWRSS